MKRYNWLNLFNKDESKVNLLHSESARTLFKIKTKSKDIRSQNRQSSSDVKCYEKSKEKSNSFHDLFSNIFRISKISQDCKTTKLKQI